MLQILNNINLVLSKINHDFLDLNLFFGVIKSVMIFKIDNNTLHFFKNLVYLKNEFDMIFCKVVNYNFFRKIK